MLKFDSCYQVRDNNLGVLGYVEKYYDGWVFQTNEPEMIQLDSDQLRELSEFIEGLNSITE